MNMNTFTHPGRGRGRGSGGGGRGRGRGRGHTSTAEEQWRDGCEAKELLRKLLTDESSWISEVYDGTTKSIDAIHCRESLFTQYKKERFRTNFRNLKNSIDNKKKAIAFDQKAYDHEQSKWPVADQFATGGFRWAGSRAQQLLRIDLADESRKKLKPKALYEQQDRKEYRYWTLAQFRDYYYEEKKWETQGVYWQAQRNNDMRKKTVERLDNGQWAEEPKDDKRDY
jgi:hypothetical protein